MKKSTLFGLAMLGAGAGLFLHLLFGPLDGDLKREAQKEIELAQKFIDSHSQRTTSLNALLKKYPKLKEVPAVEEDLAFLRRETRRIEQIRPLVKSLREGLEEDSGLNEGNFRDQMVSLQLTVDATGILLGVYREEALKTPLTNTHASAAEGRIKTAAEWFDNPQKALKTLEAKWAQLDPKNILDTMDTDRRQLVGRFVDNARLASGLKTRLDRVANLVSDAETSLKRLRENASKPSLPFGTQAMRLNTNLIAIEKGYADWQNLMREVPKDIDKLLVDMEDENGRFKHKYRTVTDGKAVESGWKTVSRTEYLKHEKHLGMTIYSKPAGTLPEDATEIAGPPGYNYVGNPRYGRWVDRGGSRFWEFYGRYRLMQDLFWGVGGYRPIYYHDYRGYRSSIRRRSSYFGGKKQYGTAAAVKSSRYKNSSYASRQRERTRYSSSKYSGSKRSGGYRSSRYRSSSFGGGGK